MGCNPTALVEQPSHALPPITTNRVARSARHRICTGSLKPLAYVGNTPHGVGLIRGLKSGCEYEALPSHSIIICLSEPSC